MTKFGEFFVKKTVTEESNSSVALRIMRIYDKPRIKTSPEDGCLHTRGYNFAWVGSMRDWQSSDVRPITRFEKIDIQANIQALI